MSGLLGSRATRTGIYGPPIRRREHSERQPIDPRLVEQLRAADPEYGQDPCRGEHGASGYMNYGCRCEVCTAAHNHMVGGQRAARYAQRVLIDGRLVHPNATHGRPSTYLNWGCRCPPCTDAKRAA